MKRASLLDGLTCVAAVALISFGVWVALAGPEGPLPVHYNTAGQVDRWGGRIEVGALLAGLGLLTAVAGGCGGSSRPARASSSRNSTSRRVR